ncbi:hypothetical protein L9F63_008198 [Diploptera punctata]|uniref:Uncharacterized protein n=1 Tax=Diploptera punctata TaxID=6984 RepID=A0AAD7Z6I4_DIPPU|nr:hypothetical protein L9F63_008198 [Diploptera punctata]
MRFLSRENSGPVTGDRPYFPATKWTLQFHIENYMDILFTDLHTKSDDWEFLNPLAAAQYLPDTKQSLQICHLRMKHKVKSHLRRQTEEMKCFKLFEADVVNAFQYLRSNLFALLFWIWRILKHNAQDYPGRRTKVITVSFSPHEDGRYFMTGSFDRSIKFWDLEDTTAPITVNKKGSVTDGAWLTHWLFLNGLSTSDWINGVAQGTQAGELTVIFAHQLLIAVDTEKGMKDKRMMISFTEMKDMDKSQEEYDMSDSEETVSHTSNPTSRASSATPEDNVPCDPDIEVGESENDAENVSVSKRAGPKCRTYNEAEKRCGLILCDFPTNNFQQMPHEARLWMRQSDKMKPAEIDEYPVPSINRVSWNPNSRSFLWLAAGYQCGLVRVPCITALNSPYMQGLLQQGERKVSVTLNKS